MNTDSIISPDSYDVPQTAATADTAYAVSTILIDSIAGDTIDGRIPHFITTAQADSMRVEAVIDSLTLHTEIHMPARGASEGLAPLSQPTDLGTGTGSGLLRALMVLMLIVLSFNAGGLRHILRTYRSELWSVRKRHNVFDNESGHTSGPLATLLAINYIVFGGVMLYFVPGAPPSPSFFGAAASMALLGLFYGFRYAAYSTVGYAFTDSTGRHRWLEGFMATRAYAGLLLILPAILCIFYPQWRTTLVNISLIIYFAANILFIAKGFRIFYRNFLSLLYFILYLCSLEIIPLLAMYALAIKLWGYTS